MNRRVGIVGAGFVGATAAYALASSGVCDEIVLFDIVTDVAIAKSLDIAQASSHANKSTTVKAALKPEELKDCDVVVITAGVPRKSDMTRADLLMINAKIMLDVVNNIKKNSPDAIIICVSNPLDVMNYVIHQLTKWDKKRIVGMAGSLDSARMSYQIREKLGYGSSDIKAMVIGEHGENMMPVAELSSVGGVALNKLLSSDDMREIEQKTKKGGAEIVKHLGTSAYYAPGSSVAVMVKAILDDSKIVMSSSVLLDGEYGHKDVCVGVPVVLGRGGVESIIELELSDERKKEFDLSVKSVKDGIEILENEGFFS